MTLLREVLEELFSMFVADVGVTIATLLVVATSAWLAEGSLASPIAGGAVLLVGSLCVLIGAVWRSVARARAKT